MNLHEHKKSLRLALKEQRGDIPSAKRTELSQKISQNLQKIEDFNGAKSIFCYISYLSEVDTHRLIAYSIRQNLSLAVPKITGKTEMIAVKLSDQNDLAPDSMGILTPNSNQEISGPFDIAITPGLGFTIKGERLGYGRGYYDRWFSKHEVKTKIALAFELQLIDALPTEKTDQLVDIIVTEERIIDLRHEPKKS